MSSTEVTNTKRGRPRLKLDAKKVRELASINCSFEEMALILDCSVSTLQRNYAQAIEKGRAEMKASLKRKQYEIAMGSPATYDDAGNLLERERAANVTMLIWLGKTVLGQSERQQIDFTNLDDLSDEQLAAIASGHLPRR